jgi:hypothetical protein
MQLSQDRKRQIAVVAVVLVILAGPALAALSPYFISDSGVKYGLSGGPTVTTDKQYNITSGAPYDDSQTVNITTENNGRATFQSSVNTEVTIDNLEGSFSNFSAINTSNGNLKIDPGDKDNITVGGSIDSVQYRDATVDDEKLDFTYSASSDGAVVNVSTNASGDESYGAIDMDTGEALGVAVTDPDGRIEFNSLDSGTHHVKIEKLGILQVRREQPEHPLIDSVTAEFKFFEDENEDPVIVNRTTSNGEIDLKGLPSDEPFVVTIKAKDYNNRSILIPDLAQQDQAYLIKKNVTTIENRFQVNDATGEFPADKTKIVIQHAINESLYKSNGDGFDWRAVSGDDLGADEAFVDDLEEEDRYRIVVQNEDGDRRILGAYNAEAAGTIELNIGRVVVDPEADDIPGIRAFRNNTSSVFVSAEFNDSTDSTDQVTVEIYERGNESNVLFANTTFNGPIGSVKVVEEVADAENNTEWVVELTYEQDGETFRRKEIVGPRSDAILGDMAPWLRAVLSLGSLILVAGLFSRLNGAVGGLIVASLSGLYWFVGFLPEETGGPVIALALVVAGLLFVNETRDGGFG